MVWWLRGRDFLTPPRLNNEPVQRFRLELIGCARGQHLSGIVREGRTSACKSPHIFVLAFGGPRRCPSSCACQGDALRSPACVGVFFLKNVGGLLISMY